MEVDGTLVYTLLFDNEFTFRAWVSEKSTRMVEAGWVGETPVARASTR